MIEKILEKIEQLKVHKAILMLNEHPLCVDIVEMVSKQKVLEIVQEVAKEYGNVSDTDLSVVSALPSLYPLQPFEEEAIHKVVASSKEVGWIPCSERLPEIEADVLLSLRSLDIYTGFRANTEGCFYVEGEGYVEFENVLAWQPLPAPYQKGE